MSVQNLGVGLDQDLPSRIEQSSDDDQSGGRIGVLEALTKGTPDQLPILRVDDDHPHTNDVAPRSAKPLDRLEHDLETPLRLLVGITLNRLPVRVDGSGSGNGDPRSPANSPGKTEEILVR